MQIAKTYTAEIKSRGQLTIPKTIRESGVLENGQYLLTNRRHLPTLFATKSKIISSRGRDTWTSKKSLIK